MTTVVDRIRTRLVWERHAARTDELCDTHPLRYLFLEVTRRCNLACRYCGSSCTGRLPPDEMDVTEWVGVVEQIARDFDPRQVMIAVTGGEPLLKEGIFELFRALQRLGFRYGMVSNGQLLDATMAQDLVRSGIRSISLSLDGVPEVNDALRGRGAAAKVVAAVGHLRDANYRGKLEIISTITRPALARLDEMRRFVASLRVPLWRVAPVMPIGRAAENPELVPTADDVRALLEYVRAARRDKLMPSPEFSEEGFLGNRFEGHVRPYLCQCRAGITIAGIRHDGRIGACPELPAAFDQGHVRTDRFKTVWDERYEDLRDRSWMRKGDCDGCPQFKVCRGGSLHLYESKESPFLRCLYKQCKESEGRPVALGCAGAQAGSVAQTVAR
ncbi:MAG: radical SAM/SPASM domain-containing protein [Myxococcales bacterium]